MSRTALATLRHLTVCVGMLLLPSFLAPEAMAQVRRGEGGYRAPPRVTPAARPVHRPVPNRPGLGWRPVRPPPPAYHRPGWGARPVPVYPGHHYHHDDDRGSNLGAAIVGGLVAGAVVGIIANGLQDDRPEPASTR